jgi:shikimate dehydrogenase
MILKNNPNLKGLNVTIPYKEEVIPYLDKLDERALDIGAVNTIKITKNNKLIGYNTDYYGFKKALEPLLKNKKTSAFILGTGGASKAVKYALKMLGISFKIVSRQTAQEEYLSYKELTKTIIESHKIIINCTPLGTFPEVKLYPNIPYHFITSSHILFDLIYNPSETEFLKKGKKQGAITSNGLKMLELQAEKSWEIWNSPSI